MKQIRITQRINEPRKVNISSNVYLGGILSWLPTKTYERCLIKMTIIWASRVAVMRPVDRLSSLVRVPDNQPASIIPLSRLHLSPLLRRTTALTGNKDETLRYPVVDLCPCCSNWSPKSRWTSPRKNDDQFLIVHEFGTIKGEEDCIITIDAVGKEIARQRVKCLALSVSSSRWNFLSSSRRWKSIKRTKVIAVITNGDKVTRNNDNNRKRRDS